MIDQSISRQINQSIKESIDPPNYKSINHITSHHVTPYHIAPHHKGTKKASTKPHIAHQQLRTNLGKPCQEHYNNQAECQSSCFCTRGRNDISDMCHSGRIVRSLVDPGWHFQVAKTFRGQTPASTTCIVPIGPCQVDLKHRQLEPQAQRDIDTALVTYVFSMSTQAYMPPHMNMCGDVAVPVHPQSLGMVGFTHP